MVLKRSNTATNTLVQHDDSTMLLRRKYSILSMAVILIVLERSDPTENGRIQRRYGCRFSRPEKIQDIFRK